MDSPCTVSRAREVVAEEYGHTPGEKGATSSSPVVDAGEVATSAVEDVAVAQDNGDGGDEDDAEKLLREAIAARKPNAAKRLDEPEAERITTGIASIDAGVISTGDLISVVGPSHIGKTQVLYALIAGAIAAPPAGRGSCVCYFEHLERIDIARVRCLLRDRLVKCGDFLPEVVASEVDAAVKERLFVYRVSTTMQLCVTLYSLLDHLYTRVGDKIDMVLIDGLGAMHDRDLAIASSGGTNWEAVLMHMLRRLARSKLVAFAVSECAIRASVSVGAKLLDDVCDAADIKGDEIPTRPIPFMPREYAEHLVTHSIVLYHAGDGSQRGALILKSPRRYSTEKHIANGELIVTSDRVTIQQQAEVMTCSERQQD